MPTSFPTWCSLSFVQRQTASLTTSHVCNRAGTARYETVLTIFDRPDECDAAVQGVWLALVEHGFVDDNDTYSAGWDAAARRVRNL
jgi:hypothetical protein